MKKFILISTFIFTVFGAYSCNDDIDGGDLKKEIATQSIALVQATNYIGSMPGDTLQKPTDPQIIDKNYLYKITDQDQLKSFIQMGDSSAQVPTIDFSKETVLVAQGTSTSGIEKIEKSFSKTANKEYCLTVDITRNAATVVERWIIALIVPKIENDAKVDLKVNYK